MDGFDGFIEFLHFSTISKVLNLLCFPAEPCVLHLSQVELQTVMNFIDAQPNYDDAKVSPVKLMTAFMNMYYF